MRCATAKEQATDFRAERVVETRLQRDGAQTLRPWRRNGAREIVELSIGTRLAANLDDEPST